MVFVSFINLHKPSYIDQCIAIFQNKREQKCNDNDLGQSVLMAKIMKILAAIPKIMKKMNVLEANSISTDTSEERWVGTNLLLLSDGTTRYHLISNIINRW